MQTTNQIEFCTKLHGPESEVAVTIERLLTCISVFSVWSQVRRNSREISHLKLVGCILAPLYFHGAVIRC